MRETATDAFLGDLAGGATFNDVSGERGEGLSKARSRRGVRIINLSDPWFHVDKGKFCGRHIISMYCLRPDLGIQPPALPNAFARPSPPCVRSWFEPSLRIFYNCDLTMESTIY